MPSSPPAASRIVQLDAEPDYNHWPPGLLNESQARRLTEMWPNLPDDWATAPEFRGLREHTRAYIELLRKETT